MKKILFFFIAFLLFNEIPISKRINALEVIEVTSQEGIKAYLSEDNTNPIVSMSFQFSLGSSNDPQEKLGLSNMVSMLLDEGAGSYNSYEFQSELEDYGIKLSFNNSMDFFSGNLTSVSSNLDKAMHLLFLALHAPRFDKEPTERIKRQIRASIIREEERPSSYARKKLYSTIFPNHPYGSSLKGSIDTIETISPRDLKNFVKKRFTKSALKVGVAGNINEEKLIFYLDKVFGNLSSEVTQDKIGDIEPNSFGTLIIEREFPQSVILATSAGLSRTDSNWYASFLANHILGGGAFTSRLMTEIREKRGLAYSVSSSLISLKHSNMIYFSLGTRNESVGESVKILKDEWQKFQLKGITSQELRLAKDYIIGSWPLRFTSSQGIASILVFVQYYGLGVNYISERNKIIESISIDQVNEVIKKTFNSNRLSFLIVGMPEGLSSGNY